MVFRNREVAEVFLWAVGSAAPAAGLVPAWAWEQLQDQNR